MAQGKALDVGWIRDCARRGDFLLSLHADVERRNEDLSVDDVELALGSCEILEMYPEDQRGHSCLVLGFSSKIAIHLVLGANKAGILFVITVYIPSMPKWKNPRERAKHA